MTATILPDGSVIFGTKRRTILFDALNRQIAIQEHTLDGQAEEATLLTLPFASADIIRGEPSGADHRLSLILLHGQVFDLGTCDTADDAAKLGHQIVDLVGCHYDGPSSEAFQSAFSDDLDPLEGPTRRFDYEDPTVSVAPQGLPPAPEEDTRDAVSWAQLEKEAAFVQDEFITAEGMADPTLRVDLDENSDDTKEMSRARMLSAVRRMEALKEEEPETNPGGRSRRRLEIRSTGRKASIRAERRPRPPRARTRRRSTPPPSETSPDHTSPSIEINMDDIPDA